MSRQTTSSSAPNWCHIKSCGVRVNARGPGQGQLVGYLWESEKRPGHFLFAYHPNYVVDPLAVPINPFELPLSVVPYESPIPGFTGPLAEFERHRPGVLGRRLGLAAWASLIDGKLSNEADRRRFSPRTALTELVWASFMGTMEYGPGGWFFDPTCDGPDEDLYEASGLKYWTERIRPPVRGDTEFWNRLQSQIAALKPRQADPQMMIRVLMQAHANQDRPEEYWSGTLLHSMPLPGQHLRLRIERPEHAPHFLWMPATEQGQPRRHRMRMAYLQLAAACGIEVVSSQVRQINNRDMIMTEIQSHGAHFHMPVLPPHKTRQLPEEMNVQRWLAQSSQAGIYLGRSPHHEMPRLVRWARNFHVSVDPIESYRRFVFAVLTGTLAHDQSRGMAVARIREDLPFVFPRDQMEIKLLPLHRIGPDLLPFKTALRMRRRLIRQAHRYIRAFGILQEDGQRVIVDVIQGLKEWRRIFESVELNQLEFEGVRPALFVPDAESGDLRTLNRPVHGVSRIGSNFSPSLEVAP